MCYMVAIIVAGLVIAGAAWFVRHTERSLKQRARAAIKEGQAAGRLPPDIDAEQIDLADYDMELPASRVSYRLRILRSHGLIRVKNQRRYHLTPQGRTIISAVVAAQTATLKQLNALAA